MSLATGSTVLQSTFKHAEQAQPFKHTDGTGVSYYLRGLAVWPALHICKWRCRMQYTDLDLVGHVSNNPQNFYLFYSTTIPKLGLESFDLAHTNLFPILVMALRGSFLYVVNGVLKRFWYLRASHLLILVAKRILLVARRIHFPVGY